MNVGVISALITALVVFSINISVLKFPGIPDLLGFYTPAIRILIVDPDAICGNPVI